MVQGDCYRILQEFSLYICKYEFSYNKTLQGKSISAPSSLNISARSKLLYTSKK